MTEAAAIACLQKAAEAETMRGLAKRLGISAGHLCHVLKGRKDPSVVLGRFGFERTVSYRRVAAFSSSRAPAVLAQRATNPPPKPTQEALHLDGK